MGGVIESNIPEGTAWPNLSEDEYDKPPYLAADGDWYEWDEAERCYSRSQDLRRFAHLDSPVWSASAQWDSYIALKIREDEKRA